MNDFSLLAKVITEGLNPNTDNDIEQRKLKEKDLPWLLEHGWKETRCFHCGMYFLEKNWNTPSACPICHWSRVD